MKRQFYIFAFTVLGVLLGFLLHAIIEIGVIEVLVLDWEKYGLGLRYAQWMMVHNIFVVLLVVGGSYVGFRQGQHWWHVLYVLKKYGIPRF